MQAEDKSEDVQSAWHTRTMVIETDGRLRTPCFGDMLANNSRRETRSAAFGPASPNNNVQGDKMNCTIWKSAIAGTLLVALASPTWLTAQGQPDHHGPTHHYVISLGAP